MQNELNKNKAQVLLNAAMASEPVAESVVATEEAA